MALRRLSMRKIHTTLRLFFEAGLSIRAIARTLRVSPEVPAKAGMGDDLRRTKGAGLSWSLPEGMDERALEARLFPGAGAACDAAVGARSHRAAAQGGHPVAVVAGVQGRASRWDSVQPVLRALPRLSTSRCPTTPSNSPCPPTTTTSAGRPASTEPPQETPPMLTHPTIDKLHQLRCPAMAAALAEPLHSPHCDALSFEEPSACSPTANSPCATTAACPADCDAPSCDTPTPASRTSTTDTHGASTRPSSTPSPPGDGCASASTSSSPVPPAPAPECPYRGSASPGSPVPSPTTPAVTASPLCPCASPGSCTTSPSLAATAATPSSSLPSPEPTSSSSTTSGSPSSTPTTDATSSNSSKTDTPRAPPSSPPAPPGPMA